MFILLKSFGFQPTLVSIKTQRNIYFLKQNINLKEILNYSEDIHENDYDFFVVNSDQVWSCFYDRLLEVGFLSFTNNWNVSKFVYAASLGHDMWSVSDKVINSAKKLVKQFSGISVREQNSVKIIQKKLGVKPDFVLDPTFLIDKNEYLKLIKNFKAEIDPNKNYLCSYILNQSPNSTNFINNASKELNYNIINIKCNVDNYIEKFIFYMNKCKALITDSFHGTVFSIIFSKPFITFINKARGKARFISLNQTLELHDRIIFSRIFLKSDIDLLIKKPDINMTNFNILKNKSLNFIKKNLKVI